MLLIGTPVIWWGGILALLFAVAMWVGARDWRFGVAVVGAASTWLPWLLYDDRPIFFFYAIATLPFLVLGADAGDRQADRHVPRCPRRGVPPGWSWPGRSWCSRC